PHTPSRAATSGRSCSRSPPSRHTSPAGCGAAHDPFGWPQYCLHFFVLGLALYWLAARLTRRQVSGICFGTGPGTTAGERTLTRNSLDDRLPRRRGRTEADRAHRVPRAAAHARGGAAGDDDGRAGPAGRAAARRAW